MNTTPIPIPADLVVQLQQTRDPLFADEAVFMDPTPADLTTHHDDYLYGDAS